MAYTVLARRYRSQSFDDVVGQDPVAQTLKNAIQSGRVAHAYLFSGTRGVGKTTMARILAKSLNCLEHEEPTTTPCCKCDSCVEINLGDDLDVIEIDGASNNGVDNIRELRQNAIYRPARGRFKIYIIDEVHMLSTGAFNALLKILEEPPEHVKFIFATTEPNKVLPTIQSRCQRFDFNSICPADVAGQLKSILKQEKIKAEDDLILHLSRLANGSMRDGLSLLDQLISAGTEPLTIELLEEFLGEPNRQKIQSLLSSIGVSDAATALTLVDELIRTGLTCTQIADSLIDNMRDLMVLKSTDPMSDLLVLTADERKQMTELAKSFDLPGLIYNITALEKLRWTIKNSDNPRALMEASVLRLTLSEHFLGIEHLVANIGKGSSAVKKKHPIAASRPTPVAAATASSSPTPSPAPVNTAAASVEPANTQINAVMSGDLSIDTIQQNYTAMVSSIKAVNHQIGNLLSGAAPLAFDADTLTLGFANEFTRSMGEKKAVTVGDAISSAAGQSIKVKFEISTGISAPVTNNKPTTPAAASSPPPDAPGLLPPGAKISMAKRTEIESDPAIVLIRNKLNARIMDIEEVFDTDAPQEDEE